MENDNSLLEQVLTRWRRRACAMNPNPRECSLLRKASSQGIQPLDNLGLQQFKTQARAGHPVYQSL